ncbi:MAG: hypothetical protein HRU25_12110 [Psychrobium sp.]|nr:hypothetical protein [Psychrobium sp.]
MVALIVLLSGCSTSGPYFYPSVHSNNPKTVLIFVGAALIIGKLQGPCNYSHPEDQKLWLKAQQDKVNEK